MSAQRNTVVEGAEAAAAEREAASPAPLSVRRISSWTELKSVRNEWTELARSCDANNFFLSWAWLSCWWQAYGSAFELFVLLCRDAEDRLAGIAPLYRTRLRGDGFHAQSLRLIGDGSDDADGFGLLARVGFERKCVRSVLEWLAANPTEWDLLELNSMPEGSTCARELFAQVREREWAEELHWTPRLMVYLPRTWDEYLRGLSAKVRQTWMRKIRHAEKDFSVRLRRCEREGEVAADVETAITLHQKSWKARGLRGKLDVAERQGFYRLLTQQAFVEQQLDLWLLELDGVARAARVGFITGTTRHAMLAGMDPEFARYGVGTILEALVLKECIKRGLETYDFLAGDDAYKAECGATRRRYMNLKAARPRTRTAMLLGAQKSLQEGKQWLRTQMPAMYHILRKARGRGGN